MPARTSTDEEEGEGGVVDRIAVVVSVDTLTATDSVEAMAVDDASVLVVVSVVAQPGNAAIAHSMPSTEMDFSTPFIRIASFSEANPPENEFHGRVCRFASEPAVRINSGIRPRPWRRRLSASSSL